MKSKSMELEINDSPIKVDFTEYLYRIGLLSKLLTYHWIPQNPLGGTCDPNAMSLVNFEDDVYGVSLKKYEQMYNRLPSEEETRKWLIRVNSILQIDGHCIGWWSQWTSPFYLDVTIPIFGKSQAIARAKDENQLSIYDYGNSCCIFVDPDEAVAA